MRLWQRCLHADESLLSSQSMPFCPVRIDGNDAIGLPGASFLGKVCGCGDLAMDLTMASGVAAARLKVHMTQSC